jgi:hypothetical protein
VFCTLLANAQDKIVVKEDFDSNRFQWEEFFEKEYSGSVQDGYYILQNKKDGYIVRSITELPINIDGNFKISFKFLVPKLNDSYYFGIIFNYEDENNYSNFVVSEKKFKMFNLTNGIISLSRKNDIILKSGKNREVVIELEKKGPKLIFRVDNLDAIQVTKNLEFNTFGFQVENENTIKVDEVIIEQLAGE